MKRIIINGDDFGMTGSASRAIARAFCENLITDSTMMANGAFFEEAVILAKENGFSDRIGVHFDLTEGAPLTAAIRTLPQFVSDGRFHKDYLRDPKPLTPGEQEIVYAELFAQIERIKRAGLIPTHADSHHYIHTLSSIAPIVAAVCRDHGIVRIRLNRTLDTPAHPRITENRMDNAFWTEQGFRTTRDFGRLTDIGETEIPDLCELMAHPDLDRDGSLIDRVSVRSGVPCGAEIGTTLQNLSEYTPIDYTRL